MRLDAVAAVDTAPLVAVDVPDPRPRPTEIAIDVEACAVCRTDLHIVEGEVPARLPIVLGHQVAGRVSECGPGVVAFQPGDRVGVGWVSSTCGACRFCRSGRENLCERALFTGRDRDGGYAERMVAAAHSAYRLPDAFDATAAAPLLCAGVIGFRTLRLSGVRPGGRLGLFGFGASAHLVLQVARREGCEVFAFTRDRLHRELAIELGAVWAGAATDDPGVLLDGAASFAPAGEIVPLALERLDRGATLAVNAIHTSPIPSFAWEKLAGERVVRSVTNFTRRDAEEFLELAAKIPVRAETVAFPLADANEALARVKLGRVRGAAVLIPGA